jgi:thymidylate kinase
MVYIAFEGIDGSGKTTQYKSEILHLRETRGDEQVAEYPYSDKNNPIGRIIKRMYKKDAKGVLPIIGQSSRIVQEAMYALNARHNLRNVRKDAEIVVSDRSIVTAYASHIDLVPDWFIRMAEPNMRPDLILFIDIPPEVGFERLQQANRDTIYFEETLEGIRIFQHNYEKIFNGRKPPILRESEIMVIDGNRPLEVVRRNVQESVDRWIDSKYDPERRAAPCG